MEDSYELKKMKRDNSGRFVKSKGMVRTPEYRKKYPITPARIKKLKAYDMKNKHKNWLRAKAAGISKKRI